MKNGLRRADLIIAGCERVTKLIGGVAGALPQAPDTGGDEHSDHVLTSSHMRRPPK